VHALRVSIILSIISFGRMHQLSEFAACCALKGQCNGRELKGFDEPFHGSSDVNCELPMVSHFVLTMGYNEQGACDASDAKQRNPFHG